jgi:leucyl aminopeptidase
MAKDAQQPSDWQLVLVSKGHWPAISKTLTPASSAWLSQLGFAAEHGNIALVPAAERDRPKAYLGLGAVNLDDPLTFAGAARALPAGRYHYAAQAEIDSARLALGWALGTYAFDRFKADPEARAELVLDVPLASETQAIIQAERDVRDWINTPPSHQGPAELCALVTDELQPLGAQIKVIVGDALITENFPTVHAVGAGSARPPAIIEARWGQAKHPLLTLVGKGVCFDTGGINLKDDDAMYPMKADMGGAAMLLALARLIMLHNVPVRLRLIIPAVDNMPSGAAMRPSDIITTRNGTTVEVGHTDYEGRLILADALAWAAEGDTPDLIIDAASLSDTGLGADFSAFVTPCDALADAVNTASSAHHDRLWRFPFWPAYAPKIESSFADVLNCEGDGDTVPVIAAALFLHHFVPEDCDWLHIDLESWNPDEDSRRPYGGNVVGLRALLAMLKTRYLN